MIELSLVLLFLYGVLHAFGPDHLIAITDFSIGKERQRVLKIVLGFAIGHGISLYLFALLLQQFDLSDSVLAWGDLVAATVILGMGVYLLFLVFANRIHLKQHQHGDHSHVHLWFGKHHEHDKKTGYLAALSGSAIMGVLMGAGGARGMLVTLSAVSADNVSGWMIISFTLGVALVFIIFGLWIAWMNKQLTKTENGITLLRGLFALAGSLSVLIGIKLIAF